MDVVIPWDEDESIEGQPKLISERVKKQLVCQ